MEPRVWSGWSGLSPTLRHANFYDARPSESIGPRYIRDFQLLFVQMGEGTVEIGAHHSVTSAGDLLFYGPNVQHTIISSPTAPLHLIGLHFLFRQDDLDLLRLQPPQAWASADRSEGEQPRCPLSPYPTPHTSPGALSAVRRHCESLVLSYLADPHGRLLEKRGLLLQLFEEWYEVMHQEKSRPPLPVAYRDAIEQAEHELALHLTEPPDLAKLSQQANLSSDYFGRLFKLKTGLSVKDFLTEQRLLKARRLLIEGQLNVSEVAHMVGFQDPYYFSRRFTRRFGVAPSVLRKQQQLH